MVQILVIEDDAALRLAVRAVLVRHGHTVVTSNNGADGLELFRTGDFQVVITDMLMNHGGMATIRELRAIRPNLAIVAMSCSDEYLRTADDLGVDATLLKPFATGALHSAIATALAKRADLPVSQAKVS